MATSTYELIETRTLSSNTSNVSFTSLPQGFRDLVLVMQLSGVSANTHNIRYNNNSSSNYGFIAATTSGPQAYTFTGLTSMNYGQLAVNIQSGTVFHTHRIFDYSQTDKHKGTLDQLTNRFNQDADMYSYSFFSNSAVTQIDIFPNTGNIASGSVFSIYGISG